MAAVVHEVAAISRDRRFLNEQTRFGVGNYRTFYDVAEEEAIVYVRAIRPKRAGKTTEDIL